MKGEGNLSFRYLKGPLIKIFRVDNNTDFWLTSLPVILLSPNIVLPLTALQWFRKGMQCSKVGKVKGVTFFNGRYSNGLPFWSQMVNKRVSW